MPTNLQSADSRHHIFGVASHLVTRKLYLICASDKWHFIRNARRSTNFKHIGTEWKPHAPTDN